MDDIFDVETTDDRPQAIELTLADAVAQMKKAWINERIARRLLPNRFDLVDSLMAELESVNKLLEAETDKTKITYGSQRTDLDRIQYVINSYIRTRLHKIETDTAFVLMQHNERRKAGKEDDLLDAREITFAESFLNHRFALFNSLFLSRLPENVRLLPVAQIKNAGRCLAQVTEERDLTGISVFDMSDPNSEILVDLPKDSTHLIPYSSIETHVEKGDVNLL
ncbi:Spd-1 [Aphelenchoides besseyi]|nr:Spd-1 [Aphelenchoides besseyi]KAI6199835.1 Spd-1 [Aphelenchoides besseyi]